MDQTHGFRRTCLVGVMMLVSGVACGGGGASTAAASGRNRAVDQAGTAYEVRFVERTRERPAPRGGPITTQSVGPDSPGGVRPK